MSSKIPVALLLIWLTVSLGAVLPTINIKFGAPISTRPQAVIPPPTEKSSNSSSYFMYFLQAIIFSVFAIAIVGGFIYRKQLAQEALAGVISLVLALLLFGLIYILADKISIALYTHSGSNPSNPSISEPLYSQSTIALIIIAAVMGILFGIFVVKVYRKKEVKIKKEVITTKEVMERAIYKVKIGKDVRGAILAAYKEMEKLMRSRGVEDKDYYTPREFREFALETLKISQKPVDTLTNLFEIARYSRHEMNEEHRKLALKALEEIRNETAG